MCKHLSALLARRTPFSQAKSEVFTANTTIKQKSTEWCFLALWSKCGGSNSGPHGPEPCARPAALHLDLVIHYITVEIKKSRCKINNINIKDDQSKICLKNIEKRGIFSGKKIFLKIFQKSVDKQKNLCYNLIRH